MGDIHQPLHTGSLYSSRVFANGDAGGNGIATEDGNLHARWDRALSGGGVATNLPLILQQLPGSSRSELLSKESDWSQWMNESRRILQSDVYSESMIEEISAADSARRAVNPVPLADAYVQQMQNIARQRIALAGFRLAIWFENELD